MTFRTFGPIVAAFLLALVLGIASGFLAYTAAFGGLVVMLFCSLAIPASLAWYAGEHGESIAIVFSVSMVAAINLQIYRFRLSVGAFYWYRLMFRSLEGALIQLTPIFLSVGSAVISRHLRKLRRGEPKRAPRCDNGEL
jgi:hypothetical protein